MSQSTREDGRKALTVYLNPEIIQSLKVKALREHTHAYLIVEQLLENHLFTNRSVEDEKKD